MKGARNFRVPFLVSIAALFLGTVDARADEGDDFECAHNPYATSDGYWFTDGSEEDLSILTEIASALAACRETSSSVEVAFPAPERIPRDPCPLPDDASAVSDQRLEQARAIDACFAPFAFAVGRNKVQRFAVSLERELASDDWQRALIAAIALRDLGDEDAGAWRIAARHWYPPVRLIAAQALAGDTDLDALHPNVGNDPSGRIRAVSETYASHYCAAQATSWQGTWVKNEPGLPEKRSFTLEPLERVQGWPLSLPINTRRPFANGLLVSNSMGEWGGAVYFFRAPELPRRLLSDVVHATRVFGDVAMAYASIAHMGVSTSVLYRITLDAHGVPQPAETLAVLPEESWKVNWRDDRSAVVIGDSGLVYRIPADGTTPSVLGCVKNAEHRGDAPWRANEDPYPN